MSLARLGAGDTMSKKILGWVVFFAIIGLVNLLSYLFNWGFWLY